LRAARLDGQKKAVRHFMAVKLMNRDQMDMT